MTTKEIRDDLSAEGRKLLNIVVRHTKSPKFQPGKPETYLGYKECCDALGLIRPGMDDVHWGRLLQQHGMTDLNRWAKRHGFPAVSGLIVNQTGDRKFWPGGEYFTWNNRNDFDFDWWEQQAKAATAFNCNWQPFL